MGWDIFTYTGIVTFAISGAIVAMEEEYDLFGVLLLGLVTAFGGGVIRNLITGLPVNTLWTQGFLLHVAVASSVAVFLLPVRWIHAWRYGEPVFDALGLASFSIQGAQMAAHAGYPSSAVVFAAVATGIGGGIVRDILAGRKPFVLREEVYAFWAMLAGTFVAIGLVSETWQALVLLAAVFALRMLAYIYGWRFPRRLITASRKQAKPM